MPDLFREPGADDGPSADELAALDVEYPELATEALEDFLARDVPAPVWLHKPYLLEESVTLLSGAPGSGKTLWALHVVMQIAKAGGRSVIIENEGGEGALQKRLRRAAAAVGGVRDNSVHLKLRPYLSLMLAGQVDRLINTARAFDLVVLDSLASFLIGEDENDASAMGVAAEALDRIKAEASCAVLAIHHTTKADWKPGETPRLGSARGHGTLEGRVDASLVVKQLPRLAGSVDLELHTAKQRDEEPAPPRRFSFDMLGPAATVTESELDGRELGAPRAPSGPEAILEHVFELIPAGGPGVSKTFVKSVAKRNEGQVGKAIDLLLFRGRIFQPGRNSYLRTSHPLPDPAGTLPADPTKAGPAAPAAPFKGQGQGGRGPRNAMTRYGEKEED